MFVLASLKLFQNSVHSPTSLSVVFQPTTSVGLLSEIAECAELRAQNHSQT